MRLIIIIGALFTAISAHSQSLNISVKEKEPYKIDQEITVQITMENTDTIPIAYFDPSGSSWDSFTEVWDMNVNSKYVEVPPLNNMWNNNFPDSTIKTLHPGDKQLIREHKILFKEIGLYSLTYTIEQSPDLIQQRYADSDSTYKKSQTINTFQGNANIKFTVHDIFDLTIRDTIKMTWEDWKEYRHVKMYSRKNHFENLHAALLYPQDVYSLHVYCNGLDETMIKRIGKFKNLRALTLRNYEFNYFPKEIAELELYELTIVAKKDTFVNFENGITANNSLRELTMQVYGDLPDHVVEQKHLIILDLSKSKLTELPDLSQLQELEKLNVFETGISHVKNANLKSLPKLKELNLSGNKAFNDLTPLLACKNLEFLELNRTSIPAVPHEIENLSKLKRLTISNKVTTVSDSIGNLSDLRYLSLGGNRSLDSIPNSILKLSKLLHLDVSSTKIPALPEGISELPLEKVMIYNTNCETTKDYKILRKRLGDKFKE